jgi:NADH-quinone oxidoreductase subunit M
VAVAGVVISAIYGLRALAQVCFGPATPRMEEVAARHPPVDLRWSERFPALVLLTALLALGFWPRAISDPIHAALSAPAAAAAAPSAR